MLCKYSDLKLTSCVIFEFMHISLMVLAILLGGQYWDPFYSVRYKERPVYLKLMKLEYDLVVKVTYTGCRYF